jgi:hypothetical protein
VYPEELPDFIQILVHHIVVRDHAEDYGKKKCPGKGANFHQSELKENEIQN